MWEDLFTIIQRYQRKERRESGWKRIKKWENEFEKNHRTILE